MLQLNSAKVHLATKQYVHRQCEASTVCGRQVGWWQLDSKTESLFAVSQPWKLGKWKCNYKLYGVLVLDFQSFKWPKHLLSQYYHCTISRLVKGLQSEKVRWSQSVTNLQVKKQTLSGDVLLTAAFVSYLGYFTKSYRSDLLASQWLPFLKKQKVKIPLTEGKSCWFLLTSIKIYYRHCFFNFL